MILTSYAVYLLGLAFGGRDLNVSLLGFRFVERDLTSYAVSLLVFGVGGRDRNVMFCYITRIWYRWT